MNIKIEHVGLWCQDLEKMKEFYCHHFLATSSEKYHNPISGFSSYFLSFSGGARLELCHRPDIVAGQNNTFGFTHLALSVGSTEEVNRLSYSLQEQGFPIQNGPRITGDGYYEAVIFDPEGNQLELTI